MSNLQPFASITVGGNIIGGTDTRVLFDDGGKIGEFAGFTFNKATGALAVPSLITINGDAILTRKAAANWQLGAADAAAPVAQTLSAQSVVTATSNTAGADLTVQGSRGTGTGVGGAIVFQVAPASTTGSTPNALITAFKIGPSGSVSCGGTNSSAIALRITGLGATTGNTLFVTDSGGNANLNVLDNGSALIGRNAPATNATVGFVYIPVCAGQPTGVPTSQSGYVPIQYDGITHQLWIFDGSWRQPKTPAGAATVTWQ